MLLFVTSSLMFGAYDLSLLEGLRMMNFGIFYGDLEYFTAIW
jgi:hypothetical protein